MTELVQFGVIKDLRGELRKYDEKLLRLDRFLDSRLIISQNIEGSAR